MPTREKSVAVERPYGFGVRVPLAYDAAVEKARVAMKEQGFGILTEIDVKKTMKEKIGAEFRPYVILGACNPHLAHRALESDLGIGLLLPCNVVVYDNGDGTSTVEAMNPEAALGIVGDNPAIARVAQEAKTRLSQAIERIGQLD